jgi:predicted ABC-type ATPase
MSHTPTIVVLAGVNGAGKSSIGGEFNYSPDHFFYNPDTVAATLRTIHPDISDALANGQAWQIGRQLLEDAIKLRRDYRFETTLGGRTIAEILEKASQAGHRLHVWFCGLESPELHIARVRRRVRHGGHDIPEEKIRERWRGSRENLIRLMPHIHHLRVYDNSYEADPVAGERPRPVLWLETRDRRITAPADFRGAPDWVIPIIAAAMSLHRMSAQPGTAEPQPGGG